MSTLISDVLDLEYELGLLSKLLALLDLELSRVSVAIDISTDPDSDGLCDMAEFLIGSGFVAVQRYINSTRVCFGLSQVAYDRPPMLNNNIAIARAINSISNYWKHSSDWEQSERDGFNPSVMRVSSGTIQSIEAMGDLGDYPCSNALALMLDGEKLELTSLLSLVLEWRDRLRDSRR